MLAALQQMALNCLVRHLTCWGRSRCGSWPSRQGMCRWAERRGLLQPARWDAAHPRSRWALWLGHESSPNYTCILLLVVVGLEDLVPWPASWGAGPQQPRWGLHWGHDEMFRLHAYVDAANSNTDVAEISAWHSRRTSIWQTPSFSAMAQPLEVVLRIGVRGAALVRT